ncbi:MAG: nucleotidyltransferase family protein [Clostridiaceae bacterium]
MFGFNTDLQSQIEQLTEILKRSETLYDVIKKANNIGLQNYYIGAGCITQTVWNYQVRNDLTSGISDIDFVYYDNSNLSFAAENVIIERVTSEIKPHKIKLDIKNQARVHLWYKERFGYDINPYRSVEDAINTWPTTATSVGVRLENDSLKVYAPFGLNDLFGMIVKANKAQITEEIYMQKVSKWSAKWPTLTIIPW